MYSMAISSFCCGPGRARVVKRSLGSGSELYAFSIVYQYVYLGNILMQIIANSPNMR